MSNFEQAAVLVVATNPLVVEAATATGLALGVPVHVASSRAEMRRLWDQAAVRLVDVRAVSWVPPGDTHDRCWVVDEDAQALAGASAILNVPIVQVPHQQARLAELMRAAVASETVGSVITVAGASGGVGTSTVAVALAAHAQRLGKTAVVVELARHGGGLDLLLGAEMEEGLRWDALRNVRGEVGELSGLLEVNGLAVLPLSQGSGDIPEADVWQAVVRTLSRQFDVVVIDAADGRELAGQAVDVLVMPADLRGVAAARMWLRDASGATPVVVVRKGKGRSLPPAAVAEAVGASSFVVVHHDARVPSLAAEGTSVTAPVARHLRRDVKRLWDVLAA